MSQRDETVFISFVAFVAGLCCDRGLPSQRREDLHAWRPQKQPRYLPDIRAKPKQQELQNLQYFSVKVNSTMNKSHMCRITYCEVTGMNLWPVCKHITDLSSKVLNQLLKQWFSRSPSPVTRSMHLSATLGSPPCREDAGFSSVCIERCCVHS